MGALKFLRMASFLLLSGCWNYSISNIDKPPKYEYESWYKKDTSDLQVKKDLLECGEVDVFNVGYNAYNKIGIFDEDEKSNYHFLVSLCMENVGYKYKGRKEFTVEELCKSKTRVNYPACKENVVVQKPSKEKRLTSHYCKIKKESFNECKDNKTSNCGEMSYIPWECFTEEESRHAELYKAERGSRANTKSSNTGSHFNPEAILMRNQQIETDKFQNQIRQQTNKEMNRMLKQ